jgi:hypothetical protein
LSFRRCRGEERWCRRDPRSFRRCRFVVVVSSLSWRRTLVPEGPPVVSSLSFRRCRCRFVVVVGRNVGAGGTPPGEAGYSDAIELLRQEKEIEKGRVLVMRRSKDSDMNKTHLCFCCCCCCYSHEIVGEALRRSVQPLRSLVRTIYC